MIITNIQLCDKEHLIFWEFFYCSVMDCGMRSGLMTGYNGRGSLWLQGSRVRYGRVNVLVDGDGGLVSHSHLML